MIGLRDNFRSAVWKREGFAGRAVWLALQPASGLFSAGVALRNLGYRVGVLRAQHIDIPVVSVGNLSVGGTGKTPLTLWLARRLSDRGWRVAIVLRGYAGTSRDVTVVSRGSGPEAEVDRVGDEATMLAKSFAGVVITARRRVDGARLATELDCNVVLLDDGFQHRALARDFDLVLIGNETGTPLPAGPMREGWSALRRAHAVGVVTKAGQITPSAQYVPPAIPTFQIRFSAECLIESDGGVWRKLPMTRIAGRKVAVVSGIADAAPFYATLREWDANIVEVSEFGDHHRYTVEEWQKINREVRGAELVVTTEKDLVKLEHFPFERGKLVAVRIAARVDDDERLVQMIEQRIAGVAEQRQAR